ncbi:MAG: hypothetical protein FVQ77_16225 [Cytophagales bacterium]|nr:hypothetical protein [Cytophagales bacterium]
MKKILLILLGVIVVLFALVVTIPIIYKDEIKAKIDEELAKSINAQVYFDADKFGISLLTNFPNLTLKLGDFGIIGKDTFEGDTLTSIKSFRVVVDLMSVISGDQIKINGIYLINPRIFATVLEDSTASWDIFIAGEEELEEKEGEEPSDFSIKIKKWEIKDGYIVFDDRTAPMYAEIVNLNHTGSGDFTQDILDLVTNTKIDALTLELNGVKYFNKNTLDIDFIINMDMPNSKYIFKENKIKINDFSFGFDGFLTMNEKDINMDITFKTKETRFKNILSLVPGVFLEGFEDLKTSGSLAFNGFAKGTYNENSLPAFGLKLIVNDGMLQYPDLPTAINNITLDLYVDNKDGILDNTVINIKKFHMDMGNNPVDARVLVEGLADYKIDADVLAKINLAELTKMIPMEGLALKGLFSLDVKAKGIYSETQMPAVTAAMNLKNGYVKTADFPSALEKLNFNAFVNNPTGKLSDTKILVEDFMMEIDGEPMQARMSLKNLDDPAYDVDIQGSIDLAKITKIFPLEDMTLSGKILADVYTRGRMSYIEAGRYDKLSSSGSIVINDINFVSADLPQGLKITNSKIEFDPKKVTINNFDGWVGKSDIHITGNFFNYIAWMFAENQTIRGDMIFNSNKFDVNEWMTEESSSGSSSNSSSGEGEGEEPLTVVEIPADIDFTLQSAINEVLYDNMTLKNFRGTVLIRDQMLKLIGVTFETLGGTFTTNATYDSRDINHPRYDLDLDISEMAIKDAYNTFSTVRALAPIAKTIDGYFSTKFKVNGELAQDMMPLYNNLTGGGLINVSKATLKGLKLLDKMNEVTKLSGTKEMKLKDVLMEAEIKDGRIFFKPFDVISGNNKMNIAGSNGIDGSIDYLLKMDVPGGAVSKALNTSLASITGKNISSSDRVKFDLNVSGTHNDPKIKIAGSSAKDQVKEVVKETVKQEVDKVKQQAEQKAKEELEKKRKEAELKAKAEAERLRKAAEKKKREAEQKAKAATEKKKKELEQKAKDELKKKLGWP